MSNDPNLEPRTLLMQPDAGVRRTWEGALRARGHSVMGTAQGDAARLLVESFRPDLIVWDASDNNGETTIRSLREGTDACLIAVGAELSSERRAGLLLAGADVVLTLPFHTNELLAQTTALLRRPRSVVTLPPSLGTRRRFGPLEIDAGRREATANGKRLTLTRIEFDVLAHLCSRPTEMASRDDLIVAVWGPDWGPDWDGDTHMVDVHISNLRRKLDQAVPGLPMIQTVRGLGFRLAADIVSDAP
jgi:two-component system OmpR family response regulator